MHVYQTPMGAFGTWEEAMEACERNDMDPVTCIEIALIQCEDVSWIEEYGLRQKLSNQIRVF